MKQTSVYTIDLTKIEGKGEFPCPRCGTLISPDDNTEETYAIVEPKVNSQGLSEIIIRCKKCTTHIHLTGFTLLQQTIPYTKTNQKHTEKSKHAATLPTYNLPLINNSKPTNPHIKNRCSCPLK